MSALVVLPEDFGRLKRGVMVPCRLLTKGGADVVLDRCSHQVHAALLRSRSSAARCRALRAVNGSGHTGNERLPGPR